MPTLTQPQAKTPVEARTEAREILDKWTRIYSNKTPLVEKPEYVFNAWVVVGCIAAAAVIVALRLLGFGG